MTYHRATLLSANYQNRPSRILALLVFFTALQLIYSNQKSHKGVGYISVSLKLGF